MKINIIDSIFIEKGILHTYGRDGIFRKVFLRQGNLEGRCAVYSLMMLLMFYGIINRDDLLHRVSTKTPEYVKKLKRQFRYSTTRGYSLRELRSKLLNSFKNKIPVAVCVLRKRDRDNLKKLHDMIIEQLDKGYPLQIGLWDPQRKAGHSVVVIGYSQFDLATLRLYCLDPAWPLQYASIWNNVIDVNIYYDDVDKLDYNHMSNEKVLVDSILFVDDEDWPDYLIFFPEELDSILPFEPEEQDSILPFLFCFYTRYLYICSMKYKVIITLLMFLFVGSVGNAQSFRDKKNMLLGKVKSDDTVRDNNNMCLGTINSDGTIRNNNNMRIGTASGINPKYAAVLFFFDYYNKEYH